VSKHKTNKSDKKGGKLGDQREKKQERNATRRCAGVKNDVKMSEPLPLLSMGQKKKPGRSNAMRLPKRFREKREKKTFGSEMGTGIGALAHASDGATRKAVTEKSMKGPRSVLQNYPKTSEEGPY